VHTNVGEKGEFRVVTRRRIKRVVEAKGGRNIPFN